jgi:hypothetical protein
VAGRAGGRAQGHAAKARPAHHLCAGVLLAGGAGGKGGQGNWFRIFWQARRAPGGARPPLAVYMPGLTGDSAIPPSAAPHPSSSRQKVAARPAPAAAETHTFQNGHAAGQGREPGASCRCRLVHWRCRGVRARCALNRRLSGLRAVDARRIEKRAIAAAGPRARPAP